MAKFTSPEDLSYEDYFVGLNNTLMGQVNLVRIGRAFERVTRAYVASAQGTLTRQVCDPRKIAAS
jgi:hypothetical protein